MVLGVPVVGVSQGFGVAAVVVFLRGFLGSSAVGLGALLAMVPGVFVGGVLVGISPVLAVRVVWPWVAAGAGVVLGFGVLGVAGLGVFVLGVAVFGGLVGVVLGVVACLVGVLGAAVREGSWAPRCGSCRSPWRVCPGRCCLWWPCWGRPWCCCLPCWGSWCCRP